MKNWPPTQSDNITLKRNFEYLNPLKLKIDFLNDFKRIETKKGTQQSLFKS